LIHHSRSIFRFREIACGNRWHMARVIFAMSLGALLSSCGGGGGGAVAGGSNTPPPSGTTVTGGGYAPSTGPGDTLSYFPIAAGNQWFFGATNSYPLAPAPLGDLTAHANGNQTVLGHVATVLTRTSNVLSGGPVDQYYLSSPGGITYLGTNDPGDPITPLLVPYVQLSFPVLTGSVSSITGANLPFSVGTPATAANLNVTQTIVNVGFEAVNVPAGSFPNALKQVTTLNGTAIANGQNIAVSGTDTTWLVSGIGIVKESTVAEASTKTITEVLDLKGFNVNGRRRGLGVPSQLIPVNNSLGVQVGSIASDGTNFLVVTAQVIFPTPSVWIGTLLGPDGSSLRTFSINAPTAPGGTGIGPAAVAAFDGTNYLVVYTQDHFSTAPFVTTLDAARISPAGALVGTPVTIASPPNALMALAFDGARYFLEFSQTTTIGFYQLVGQFIDPATGQPDGAPLVIPSSGVTQVPPAVVYGGGNYLTVRSEQLSDGSTVLDAVRMLPAGTFLDATPFLISSQVVASTPGVAFDGSNYLIAFRDARTQPASIAATRVNSNGALLDGSAATAGIVLSTDATQYLGQVCTAFVGNQYWVAWEYGQGELYGARVSTTGVVTSPGSNGFVLGNTVSNVIGGFSASPVFTANSEAGLLTWLAGPLPNNTPTVVNLQLVYPPGP
jgi:hypothetical protein